MPKPYQYGFKKSDVDLSEKMASLRRQKHHRSSQRSGPTSASHSELLAPDKNADAMAVAGMVFQIKKMPPSLRAKLKTSTFLGCGLSGYVWDLHDGTVLKLTREVDTIRLARTLLNEPVHGLARICSVISNVAKGLGFYANGALRSNSRRIDSKGYSAIVMTKYDPLPEDRWALIQRAWQHLDFSDKEDGFGRGPEGAPASGQLGSDIAHQMSIIARRIRKMDASHPVAQCIMSTTMLSKWLQSGQLHRHTGLDIDHRDNWGIDKNGNPIMIDPLYTRNVGREEQLRALSQTHLPLEPSV